MLRRTMPVPVLEGEDVLALRGNGRREREERRGLEVAQRRRGNIVKEERMKMLINARNEGGE